MDPQLLENKKKPATQRRDGVKTGEEISVTDGCIKTAKTISAVMTWFFKGRQYYKLSGRDTEVSVLADMH